MLNAVYLTQNRLGLNICITSVKFAQCQTVFRKALISSSNIDINQLWTATSNHTNIQYNAYNPQNKLILFTEIN